MTASFIYRKPSRYSHNQTSMHVLCEIPEHIVEQYENPSALAESVVSALNCCRKYSKGLLTIGVDSDLEECVAIKYQGQVRAYKALQALNLWMSVDEAFSLLADLSGMPVSLRAIEAMQAF